MGLAEERKTQFTRPMVDILDPLDKKQLLEASLVRVGINPCFGPKDSLQHVAV